MNKKTQFMATISVFLTLIFLMLPGFYTIIKEYIKSDIQLSLVLIGLNLFILFATSVALKNFVISVILRLFINASNSISYNIMEGKNFSINSFQAISKFFVIIFIIVGYSVVYIINSSQYMAIYSMMFLAVYSLGVNLVPNKLLFIDENCIIFNKIKNCFLKVTGYEWNGTRCTLLLSDNSKYDIIVEQTSKGTMLEKLNERKIKNLKS